MVQNKQIAFIEVVISNTMLFILLLVLCCKFMTNEVTVIKRICIEKKFNKIVCPLSHFRNLMFFLHVDKITIIF